MPPLEGIPVFRVPLFVPGDRPERFPKAAASGADAVVLDLEDAVAPEAKPRARAAIAARAPCSVPVIVRVNPAGTEAFAEDLACLGTNTPDAVMLAKAEGRDGLADIRDRLGARIPILPLIETAAGLDRLGEWRGAPGIAQLVFGSLDLAVDLGCEPDWEPLQAARAAIVLASRRAELPAPIEGVTPATDDLERIRADAILARRWGFGGKLAIHPAQIGPILEALRPTPEDLRWARAVVAAAPQGQATRLEGRMIDRPVLERARRLLRLAGEPEGAG